MTEVSQLLQNFSSLAISGPDALNLLQGQFTADLRQLVNGQNMYSAYCDVKGKVGWFFVITMQDGVYHVSMPSQIMPSFITELTKYALFSDVKLGQSELSAAYPFDVKQDIYKKIPIIYLATQFKFFPHDLRLDELGALSFKKGCFKGQEIIARMEHRGNIKRRTYVISHSQLTEIGAIIYASEKQEVGSVVRTHDNISLAVINESHLQELYLGDEMIKIIG